MNKMRILIILLLVGEGWQDDGRDFIGEESRKRLAAAELANDQKVKENTLAELLAGTSTDDMSWASDQIVARVKKELSLLPMIRYNSESEKLKKMCTEVETSIKERIPSTQDLTKMTKEKLFVLYTQLEQDLKQELLKVVAVMVTKHQAALEAVAGQPFKSFFKEDDLQKGNLSSTLYLRIAYSMAKKTGNTEKRPHPLLVKLTKESQKKKKENPQSEEGKQGQGQEGGEEQELSKELQKAKEEGILTKIQNTIEKMLEGSKIKGNNTSIIEEIVENENETPSKRLDVLSEAVKYLLNCNTCQLGWMEVIQIGISITGLICQIVTVCWVISARKQDKKTQKQMLAQIKSLEDDMGSFQTRTNRRVDDLRAHMIRNKEEVPRRVVAKRRGII